jgi:hypothetical protein
MLAAVQEAISSAPIGADVKLRMRRQCLPWLIDALRNCASTTEPLTVAAATERTGIAFAASAFPALDHTQPHNPAWTALQLHTAIEAKPCQADLVLHNIARLLGARGLQVLAEDLAELALGNEQPIVVCLTACIGGEASVVMTMAGMQRRTLH